jgi:hypothetical protein
MTMLVTGQGYTEAVPSARWFAVAVRLCALAPLVSAASLLRAPGEPGAGGWIGVAVLGAMSVALFFLVPSLLRLRIEVGNHDLRVRLGPFRRTIAASAIRSAQPERYRPWAFGGWGWRLGWSGGTSMQAYSVPFLRSGVAVETERGRFYLSSRSPAQLAQAIERLAREGRS